MEKDADRVVHIPPSGLQFHPGVWNTQGKSCEGSAIPRTMDCAEARYTAFVLGAPFLQADRCTMQRILKLPSASAVLCILHLMMAMGQLLGDFVEREARGVTPSLAQDLQVLLLRGHARWRVYGAASSDGEETADVFQAWAYIARCLGIRLGSAKYKAVPNMWNLLQALYCIYLGTY